MEDTLYGVWLRVYVGDQMVTEAYSPATLSQTEKWPAK